MNTGAKEKTKQEKKRITDSRCTLTSKDIHWYILCQEKCSYRVWIVRTPHAAAV